jgi:hypothetical protein
VDFVAHAVEQGFLSGLLLVTAFALGAWAVAVVPAGLITRRGATTGVWARFALASLATALLYGTAVTVYHAGALYLRYVPHGSGLERSEPDFSAFVGWAEAAFVLLAGLVLAAGAALGYAVAPTGRSRRRFALASTVAALVVVVMTLPLVEFLNACNVGESLVLDASC